VTPVAPPPPPASGGSGKKILIVVLCVFLGLFVLIGGCVAACTFIVAKKAKELKTSSERNPTMAALSVAIAFQPDLTVISKNEATGHMKVKNKRTGEITDIDTNQYNAQNITEALERAMNNQGNRSAPPPAPLTNESSSNETSASNDASSSSSNESAASSSESEEPTVSPAKAAALNAAVKKLPSFLPAYPGAKATAASLNSIAGISLGNYEFFSSDKPDTISDFYEKKLTAANFTIAAKNSDTNDYGPTATLVANRTDPAGTCAITAESQKNGTKVSISFSNK
jgi:hypothetical protein